jgi:hypothetical protein
MMPQPRLIRPTLPCAKCHKPGKVYREEDLCARCQRAVAESMPRSPYMKQLGVPPFAGWNFNKVSGEGNAQRSTGGNYEN